MERSAYSIEEFCYRNDICRATYYNLKNAGKGPREMKVGGQKRITPAAEADWHAEREAEAAAAPKAA
jgi:hypothetical protein